MSFLCTRGSVKRDRDYDNETFRPSSLSATTSPQSKFSSPISPRNKVEKARSPFSMFQFSKKTKTDTKLDHDFRNDDSSASPILDRKPSQSIVYEDSQSISYREVREFSLDLDTYAWKWSTRKVYFPTSHEVIVRSVYFHHNGVWMWDKSECVQNVPAEKVEERKPILLSADKRSQQQISNRFLTVLASSLSSESIVTCQPLRRKVFSLQAATGEYGWEYLQGAEEDGDGPSLSDQVAVVVPVKIFSESGGVWGWSSANDRPLHSYSPQELAAATSSTSPPQQQSFQTNGNVEGKGEYLKLPQAAVTTTRSPLQAVRMGVSRIYDSVFSPNLKDKNMDSHATPSRADSSSHPAPSSLPSNMSPAAADVEYAPPESVCLTYDEVKRGVILPPNIDPRIRELYLEDVQFHALFKMDKKEFMAMKKWKRDELKKKVDIF